MPGGSVYKDHTFNKETAHKSHENRTIHRTNCHSTIQYMNIHSTIQVHEHKYRYMNVTKHSRKQNIQKKTI
jgi:hypothetical protein